MTEKEWRPPKTVQRVMTWVALVLVVSVAFALMGATHRLTMIGTAGHFGGLLVLTLIALTAILIVIVYGLDPVTQAREVNAAVDRVDDAQKHEGAPPVTDAESRVLLAGGVQTAGLYIMAGLIIVAFLYLAAHQVVPKHPGDGDDAPPPAAISQGR